MFSARNLFSKTVRSRSSISGVRRAVSGSHRNASSLVVAEHSEGTLSAGSLVTITAASQLGGNVDVLLMGSASGGSNASGVAGVSKILCMENSFLDHGLAEDTASALTAFLKANGDYTHILAPSTNHGKNYIPRAAALMDSAPLSDITEVISEDTFKRPMYAGNANATVTMSDTKKFLLVRTTAFEKAETSGGSATVEKVEMGDGDIQAAMSTFVSASAKQSGRPDLSAAGVVVSGGRGMKVSPLSFLFLFLYLSS